MQEHDTRFDTPGYPAPAVGVFPPHPHTTGPWKIERDQQGRLTAIIRDMPEEDDPRVPITDIKDGAFLMTVADAHLCAAGPELVEAVRLMLSRFPKRSRRDRDIAATAREALWRAAGDTPD